MSKPLDRITLLETFVRIADSGSISAAAKELDLSQPSVSRQLAELEDRLSTQLMRRTTHSLALTETGKELLADARQLISRWDDLEEKHLSSKNEIRGKLKIVAPIALGQLYLAKIAWQFQLEHPLVSLSWQLEDDQIRFSEVGCDCWIKVGPVSDDTLVVRELGKVERLLVASHQFIKTNGMPRNINAAQNLSLVGFDPFEGGAIPLIHKNGQTNMLKPPLKLSTNNIFALKEAAIMGLGIAVMPKWFIEEEIKQGILLDILPKWRAPSLTINLAYLAGKHQSKKLRIFLDTIQQEIRNISGIIV